MCSRYRNLFLIVGIAISSLLWGSQPSFCGGHWSTEQGRQSEDSADKKQPQDRQLPVTLREPKQPGQRWRGMNVGRPPDTYHGRQLFDEGQALYRKARTKQELERAAEKFKEAQEAYEFAGHKVGAGAAAVFRGMTELQEGKSEEALKVLQQALEQSERTGVTAHEGMATNLIGNAYRVRGQLDKAEEFYKKALDMAVSTGDSLRKGRALKCLGDVDSLKGNPSGALEKYGHALETRRKLRGHSRSRLRLARHREGRAVAGAVRQGC